MSRRRGKKEREHISWWLYSCAEDLVSPAIEESHLSQTHTHTHINFLLAECCGRSCDCLTVCYANLSMASHQEMASSFLLERRRTTEQSWLMNAQCHLYPEVKRKFCLFNIQTLIPVDVSLFFSFFVATTWQQRAKDSWVLRHLRPFSSASQFYTSYGKVRTLFRQ